MSIQRRTRKRLRGSKRRKSRRQTNGSDSSSSSNFTVDPTSENTSSANLSQLPATATYLSGTNNGTNNGNKTSKNKNTNNNLGNNPLGAISTNILGNTVEETNVKKEYVKQFNQKKFTNVTNTLNTELPPGYRAVKYKNGTVYYENTKTGKTQYNYPTVTRAGNSTNLPEGWETYSFQGEEFYIDPQGKSHWNKPSAEKKKNSRQVVENELVLKEEPIPGPLPSQNGVTKIKNTAPCPVCPKLNQQKTKNMKNVLHQLKNIQNLVRTIKGGL